MTVKELEEILRSVSNKELKVVISDYLNTEANGYYLKDESFVLTNLNVQPKVIE